MHDQPISFHKVGGSRATQEAFEELAGRFSAGEKVQMLMIRRVARRQGHVTHRGVRVKGPVRFYTRVEQIGEDYYSTLVRVGILDGLDENGVDANEVHNASYICCTKHRDRDTAFQGMEQRYKAAKAGNINLPLNPFLSW